jgi:hypothetical protein
LTSLERVGATELTLSSPGRVVLESGSMVGRTLAEVA